MIKKGLKIYIETDLEGASGLVSGRGGGQIGTEDTPSYQQYRHFLTGDVNAAIEGAIEGGAEEIIVNDSHGTKEHNIFISELNPKARLLRSATGNWLPGLDKSVDAVFFIGAHAMAGTKNGFLDHTQSSLTIHDWYLNGIKVGEIGQLAAIAGHYDVPVVFVTGDLAATIEAKKLLGNNVETVAVKKGITRNYADGLNPSTAQLLIREHAKLSLSKINKVKPFKLRKPIEMKIVFNRTDYAEEFAASRKSMKPKMPDARTVIVKLRNILEMF